MSIKDLQKRWNKDKDFFSQKEIGELQDFVKDILQDNEIFGLKKGIGSTKNIKRKKEFTIETSKTGRRADFVVFINGNDVVIPVEVERHKNVEKGIEQVFQYQKDWDKKYAILTDGNEWRFYRSNKYKTFLIDDIFSNTKDFLVYWKEYIKPENYYIELFDKSEGELKERIDLNNPENREIFFEDITKVINNFKVKMIAIGAFRDLFNMKETEKIAVETSYAYLIQFILYKVLVDNGYKKFNEEYNRSFNKIKKALNDKDFYSIVINEIKNVSEYISNYIYKPFTDEQKTINEKLLSNLKEDLSIEDISPWLDILLFIDRYNFSGLKNEIFGFVYENYLKDLYQDKNKGQYFTDPAIVNFMLREIGYTEENIRKDADKGNISIIDPSCGAGTFLYSAVDRIISAFHDGSEEKSEKIERLIDKNIFGLDIEEFPLYLAEMSILMRLLPLIVNDNYENPIDKKLKIFKTRDSISEFLNTGINSKVEERLDLFNNSVKTSLDYQSFMRDEKDLEEMLKSLKDENGKRERFDYVIGNPPYIGYNECCKQNIEFTKRIKDKKDKSIEMGNVYGMNLNTVPGRIKPYSPKPNLYAFFIALGLGLLKNAGKICYIIPQTVLVAKDLDVVRYHLSRFTTIEKIITFEGSMFVARGLKQNTSVTTSSLIFIATKKQPKKQNYVEIVNYGLLRKERQIEFEKYLNQGKTEKKKILQIDLLNNIVNWNFIKHTKIFLELFNMYKKESFSIEEYRRKCLTNYDEICLDGGVIIANEKLSHTIPEDYYKVFNPKINNYKKYSLTKSDLYYGKENKVSFVPGGQGLKAFHNQFKIIWKTRFNETFQYSQEDNLILKGNQSLILSSQNKNEILFLLSIMNSKLVLKILRGMTKLPNESTYILSLGSVKEFIRIPKINEDNKHIKSEIIKQAEKLLSLEEYQLKDYVEFTTPIQRFNDVRVEGGKVILTDFKDKKIYQRIETNVELVELIINEKFANKKDILLEDLKYTEAIDKKRQAEIKDYIDDLVFSLYFNITIKRIGIERSKEIKNICEKNPFYKYLKEKE